DAARGRARHGRGGEPARGLGAPRARHRRARATRPGLALVHARREPFVLRALRGRVRRAAGGAARRGPGRAHGARVRARAHAAPRDRRGLPGAHAAPPRRGGGVPARCRCGLRAGRGRRLRAGGPRATGARPLRRDSVGNRGRDGAHSRSAAARPCALGRARSAVGRGSARRLRAAAARGAARRGALVRAAMLALSLAAPMAVGAAPGQPNGDEAVAIPAFSSAQPAPGLPAHWGALVPSGVKPASFDLVEDAGATVLRVHSRDAAGAAAYALPTKDGTIAPTLSWRWKVDRVVEGADLATRAGDDFAARVYVFFDVPASRLPLGDRIRLALARLLHGERLPSTAICYVWDNRHRVGTTAWSPYTDRVRMVVL